MFLLRQSVLKDHLATHLPDGEVHQYPCEQCAESFKSRRTRSRHMRRAHAGVQEDEEEGMTTDEGSSEAEGSERPQKKRRVDDGATTIPVASAVPISFLCGECTKSFSTAEALEDHTLATHKTKLRVEAAPSSVAAAPAIASTPAKPIAQEDMYALSVLLAVSRSPMAASEQPSAPPAQRSSGKKRAKPQMKHICTHPGCTAAFGYKHVLDNHFRAKHTMECPFECATCGKRFPTLARSSFCEKKHLRLVQPQKRFAGTPSQQRKD